MKIHEATEQAYKNGYEQGKRDAVAIEKPLEEYLSPIDAYEGLKCKYLVFKADTGERVVNCFVLRPDKDTAAVEALRTYATVTDNKTLSDDIYNWVGKRDAVKHGRWIDGVCSNCKEEAISKSWDEPIYDYDWEENLRYSYTETHMEYQLTDYCPNCGANMKGE